MARLAKLAAASDMVTNLLGFDEEGQPLQSDEQLAKQFENFASMLPFVLGNLDPRELQKVDQLAQQRFQAMDPETRSGISQRIQQLPVAKNLGQMLPGAMESIQQPPEEAETETPGATPPSPQEEAAAAAVGQEPPEAASAAVPEVAADKQRQEAEQEAQAAEPEVPSGILPQEVSGTRDMAREVLETAPLPQMPQYTGYDVVPNQNLNMRDRFGNYYYQDPSGRIFHWSQTAEPGQRLSRVEHLEQPAGTRQEVERQLIQEMSSGQAPEDPQEQAQWAAQRRSQLMQEAGGLSDAAKQLGLSRLDDVMAAAGGPVYFDRQGRPHYPSEEGLQQMSSIDLWRQANPQQAAQYDERTAHRERRMSDPRYLATLRRSYQTMGMTPPDWFDERVSQLEKQDPSFRSQMDAHAVAGQMVQDKGFQPGINYDQLYNQALGRMKTAPIDQAPSAAEQAPPVGQAPPPAAEQAPAAVPEQPPKQKKPVTSKLTVPEPDNPKQVSSKSITPKTAAQFNQIAGYRGGLKDTHLRRALRRRAENRRDALPPSIRGAPDLGASTVFNPGRNYDHGEAPKASDWQGLHKVLRQARRQTSAQEQARGPLGGPSPYVRQQQESYGTRPGVLGALGSRQTYDPLGSKGRPQFRSNWRHLGSQAVAGGGA